MKEQELRKYSECCGCGRKIGKAIREDGTLPMFCMVTYERFIIDDAALRRQAGLEMMMGGNVALAQVMGPNEDMAKRITGPVRFMVCEKCSTNHGVLMGMAERALEKYGDPSEEKGE